MDRGAMKPDPLQRFEAEHREALAMLTRLERAVAELHAGRDTDANLKLVREAHQFLTTTVREHNENEERALLPLLGEDAPTEIFEDEHRTLRELEYRLERALIGPDPGVTVGEPAQEIITLLRTHIAREDEALFPMARALLGQEGLDQVARLLD